MLRNRIVSTGLIAAGLTFAGIALPQVQPDNTKVNKQDRDKTSVTADQQKNNLSDREVTQRIRKSVMADKTLSSYAHNVKIVSQNGMVTLKGPVKSEEEKKTIEAKAIEIAGSGKVDNQITVKAQ
jgi:osmotically-inducible protein OsmY